MGNTQMPVKKNYSNYHPYVFEKNVNKRNYDKKYYIFSNKNNISLGAIGIRIIQNTIYIYYITMQENKLISTHVFDQHLDIRILKKMLTISYNSMLISLICDGKLLICSYKDISTGLQYIGKYDIPDLEGLAKIELLEKYYCLIYENTNNRMIRFMSYDGNHCNEYNLKNEIFRFSRCSKYFQIIGQTRDIYEIKDSIKQIIQKENTNGKFSVNMNGRYFVRWGDGQGNKLFIENHDFEVIYEMDIQKHDMMEYIIYDYSELGDILDTPILLLLVGINRINQHIEYMIITPNNTYGRYYIIPDKNIISFEQINTHIIYDTHDKTTVYSLDHMISVKIVEIIRDETKKYIENERLNIKQSKSAPVDIILIGADDSMATYRVERASHILSHYEGTTHTDIICNIRIYEEMTSFDIFIKMIAEDQIDYQMVRLVDQSIFNLLIEHQIEYVRLFVEGPYKIAYCGYLIMELILLRTIYNPNNIKCVDLFVEDFPIFERYIFNSINLITRK